MRARSILAVALLCLGLSPLHTAHGQQGGGSACKLPKIGNIPVKVSRSNRVYTAATVDGNPANLLIDTGSPTSVMNPRPDGQKHTGTFNWAFRLLENVIRTSAYPGKVSDLTIGDYHVKNVTFPYSDRLVVTGDVYGVLGGDLLGSPDLEVDLNGEVINLFTPNKCGESAIYWSNTFSEAELAAVNRQIVIFVELNGARARAVIDTGSAQSWISWDLARHLGLDPDSSGMIEDRPSGYLDAQAGKVRHYRFSELKVGDEIAKNVDLGIKQFGFVPFWGVPADNYLDVSMILGVDFLRNHRLYVDRTAEKVYFTWHGKAIFTPPQFQ